MVRDRPTGRSAVTDDQARHRMTSSTATPYCRAADDRHASALTSPRLIDQWWSLYQNAQNLDRACGHLRQRHCLSRTDSAGRCVMGGIRPLLTLAVVTFVAAV